MDILRFYEMVAIQVLNHRFVSSKVIFKRNLVIIRVGIKPGFYHKAHPAGFTGFMRAGFWGFMGFMWVL